MGGPLRSSLTILVHINPPKETDLDYCPSRTMSVESDHSQSRTRLNGRLGAQLQVSGKSTKWREVRAYA